MSKQEVIEIAAKFFKDSHDCGRLKMQYSPLRAATKLYDRIAPLMVREFPEKELRGLLADKELLQQIKLLIYRQFWEDQPHPKVGDNILEQDKPKGTCQTCGGSGVFIGPPLPQTADQHVCPACDATGEERRSGGGHSFLDATPKGVCEGIYTDSEGRLKKTRRVRKERREEPGWLCWSEKEQFYVAEWTQDKKPLIVAPDCRNWKDRRKAVSDDAQKARTWPHSRR